MRTVIDGEEEDGEIEVKKDHFEDVVIRRDKFIKYIDQITDQKADERAWTAGERGNRGMQ